MVHSEQKTLQYRMKMQSVTARSKSRRLYFCKALIRFYEWLLVMSCTWILDVTWHLEDWFGFLEVQTKKQGEM